MTTGGGNFVRMDGLRIHHRQAHAGDIPKPAIGRAAGDGLIAAHDFPGAQAVAAAELQTIHRLDFTGGKLVQLLSG